MKQQKHFSVFTLLLSLAGGLIAASLVSFVLKTPDTFVMIMISGLLFALLFLAGFGGMSLAMRLDRRYSPDRRPRRFVSMLIAALLLFLLGSGGQALFMLQREDYLIQPDVDMVLLLDYSSSMEAYGYDAPRDDAANQFVEHLTDTTMLQAVAFTSGSASLKGTIESQFLLMNAGGKNVIKQFIADTDTSGGTDFEAPLKLALQTLSSFGRDSASKAVILLTDGDASVPSFKNDFLKAGVKLFTVRIRSNDTQTQSGRELKKLAEDTGGTDVVLKPAGNTVDSTAMLKAFDDAFQASSDSRLVMREDYLVGSSSTSPVQFVIRSVTLLLAALLFSFGYFGKTGLKQLLPGLGLGLLLSLLITVSNSADIGTYLFALLMTPAFVWYEVEKETQTDV